MSLELPPGVDLSTIPFLPNPNGGPPNFDGPTRGPLILGVGIPLTVICTIVVAMRLYTNIKTSKKLGVEDWFCLAATILALGYFGLSCASIPGMKHGWEIPLSHFDADYIRIQYALNLLGPIVQLFSKAAIVTLYLRVFAPKVWLRWTCYVTLVVMFFVYGATVPYVSVVCTPRGGEAWSDISILWRCGRDVIILSQVQSVFSTIIDAVLVVIPLPVIYGLNLTKEKKIGLMIVFLVGILVPVVSIVNTYYRFGGLNEADPLWDSVVLYVTQFAEVYTTIVISCVPSMSSLWINHITQSVFYNSLKRSLFSRDSNTDDSGVYDIRLADGPSNKGASSYEYQIKSGGSQNSYA